MFNQMKLYAVWRVFARRWTHFLAEFLYPTILVVYLLGVGFHASEDDPRVFVAYVGVFVYVLVLLAQLAYLTHKYEHDSRYAGAVSCIQKAVLSARVAATYLEQCNDGDADYEVARVQLLLMPCMDAVAQAYSIVTGTQNRACIKLFGGEKGKLEPDHVRTFCRDSVSTKECHDLDQKERDCHKIQKNSSYEEILYNGKPYFFCNDLRRLEPLYKNSSKDRYPNKELPYKACITVPIRAPKDQTDGSSDSEQDFSTLGFLGVDTNTPNRYGEPRDIELGRIVADMLYVVLKRSWEAAWAKRKKDGERVAQLPVANDALHDPGN